MKSCILSIILTTLICSDSQATQQRYSTHRFSHVDVTYCHVHLADTEWFYYRGMAQTLNDYITENFREHEFFEKPIRFDIDCKGMTPEFPIELYQDDDKYGAYLYAYTNLEELIQVIDYFASNHELPLLFDDLDSWVDDFRQVMNDTVELSNISQLKRRRMEMFEVDSRFYIVYQHDTIWYCIDGTCLEVVEQLDNNNTDDEYNHNIPLPPIIEWEGTSNADNTLQACALATGALRDAIYTTCGDVKNVWKLQVAEWCDEYSSPDYRKIGKFRCTP